MQLFNVKDIWSAFYKNEGKKKTKVLLLIIYHIGYDFNMIWKGSLEINKVGDVTLSFNTSGYLALSQPTLVLYNERKEQA